MKTKSTVIPPQTNTNASPDALGLLGRGQHLQRTRDRNTALGNRAVMGGGLFSQNRAFQGSRVHPMSPASGLGSPIQVAPAGRDFVRELRGSQGRNREDFLAAMAQRFDGNSDNNGHMRSTFDPATGILHGAKTHNGHRRVDPSEYRDQIAMLRQRLGENPSLQADDINDIDAVGMGGLDRMMRYARAMNARSLTQFGRQKAVQSRAAQQALARKQRLGKAPQDMLAQLKPADRAKLAMMQAQNAGMNDLRGAQAALANAQAQNVGAARQDELGALKQKQQMDMVGMLMQSGDPKMQGMAKDMLKGMMPGQKDEAASSDVDMLGMLEDANGELTAAMNPDQLVQHLRSLNKSDEYIGQVLNERFNDWFDGLRSARDPHGQRTTTGRLFDSLMGEEHLDDTQATENNILGRMLDFWKGRRDYNR